MIVRGTEGKRGSAEAHAKSGVRSSALRHGYTTGACAAAAARGAALLLREQRFLDEVQITLPTGAVVRFCLQGQHFSRDRAACFVVKDAGDDPDVTNGAEIHAAVAFMNDAPPASAAGIPGHEPLAPVVIEGGGGVGRVTKPGLAVPVGDWAINPVPRRMITAEVGDVLGGCLPGQRLRVSISIPNGEELAQKTLNARLGIVGGLSILGTTGIVRPLSASAWTDTIDAAIDVALACGCSDIVLSTGRSSEMIAQRQLALPDESYIMMGDHVGYALRSCRAKGVRSVTVAAQFAKMLKIACGHPQTHVSSSDLDLTALASWVVRETRNPGLESIIGKANTAREVLVASGNDPFLIGLVCGRAREYAQGLAAGAAVKVFLAGYGGEVLYSA